MNKEDFFRHPGWKAITEQIQSEIARAQRPPSEVILDETEFCSMLHISKRTAASIRSSRQIVYYKVGGKVYYKLSDVLALLEENRVPSKISSFKIK